MSASDYGGGTPIVDVWRRDAGLALGHLELTPRLVSLPVKEQQGTACLEIHAEGKHVIAPGESFETLETFVAAHGGDYFATLDAYRRLMGERGLRAPQPPKESYEPIWCAWGYERNCTVQLIEDTLPKVKELGLSWAVIDDGWQSSVGDWNLNTGKFPGGETQMKRLVGRIKEQGLKPRLWIAPLAAAPGSDVLHDHTDMLLLDKDGAAQNVSWWNSFYLCPAYEPTVAYTLGVVRRILGDWGFAGLKIDGQHLNGVAPCFNPAHKHARPEESMEKLPEFFHAIYATAMQINPAAVIELCPCGTSYSFFDFPYINQAPASDPESSWQVRLKGKTLKALMGPSAPFAGDHVELSDHGDDFASTVGIGAVVSTKFTWPLDPKPKDSFLLTPEREREWRHWITLYNDKKLSQGIYRGELYDIGFDKPEAHVVQQSGRNYYSFYAKQWQGVVELRGLPTGSYRVRDYFNDRDLGQVSSARNTLKVEFEHFLLIEAIAV
jgi:alpha-galactosidase